LLDDDMPDAVSKFIEDLSFKTLKEKIENNWKGCCDDK
jgi:hypothetical protein